VSFRRCEESSGARARTELSCAYSSPSDYESKESLHKVKEDGSGETTGGRLDISQM
jgi:hypothetical protein